MYKKVLYLITVGFFIGVCSPVMASSSSGLEAETSPSTVSPGSSDTGGSDLGPPG